MPDRFGGRAAESRLRSWAAESGYHEHLEPASQDAHSRWFSEWFATSIVAPRQPVRVLELGCGAGRNLAAIQAALPGVEVVGVEINEAAVTVSRAATGAQIVHGSIYELGDLGRFDVAFTAGVLMHIPHENVEGVIRSMVACADATAHFELHGAPHRFDFHRYPRDYGATYAGMDLGGFRYEVFPRGDIRNGGESVGTMALLSRPALPL